MDDEFSKSLEAFINLLFAVIVGVGFRQLVVGEFFKDFLAKIGPDFRIILLFIITYFFVISDWVFYHLLMTKYPYTRAKPYRFSIDIFIFFLMFFLIYLSTLSPNIYRITIFLFTLAIWHGIVSIWHILAKGEGYDVKKETIHAHFIRTGTYLIPAVFSLFIILKIIPIYRERPITWIMILIIGIGVAGFNGERLREFLIKAENQADEDISLNQ